MSRPTRHVLAGPAGTHGPRARRLPVRALAMALCAAVVCAPAFTWAWEPATTHAGLAEQAALHSRLHQRLRDQLGLSNGLFAALHWSGRERLHLE
jgi:hypothetical protein